MSYDREDDMVEVSGELRKDMPKAWGIYAGEDTDDENGNAKEIWVFLPKSLCQQGETKNTWLVPEWLAKEKDLI